ncbi:MAG TPA: protein kinase [Ktedonobacteraceae bacterium]
MTLEGKRFNHYHVLKLIGRGSMGEVYLIEDVQVQRQIVAKIISIEPAHFENKDVFNTLRLFWREATAIARLDHPHILPLYDHGEVFIDGLHFAYITMPYRPEGSLVSWLRTHGKHKRSRQITMKQTVHVVQQAAQALQYAHDHQVMHLDVKPANFLIRSHMKNDEYPDMLLSDFGISRLVNATSRDSQHVRGTPIYMAPEQWAGHPGFASDQYALAVMAYELLTGSPPFEGGPLSVMFAHIHQLPWPARSLNPLLPPAVDLVLQRALAKKPEERFSSITAFAQALQNAFPTTQSKRSLRILRLRPLAEASSAASKQFPDQQLAQSVYSNRSVEDFAPVQTPLSLSDQVSGEVGSTTVSRSMLYAPDTTSLSSQLPLQTTTTAQKSLTFSMLPFNGQAIRLHFLPLSLILLIILFSVGSLGIFNAAIGNWPWHRPAAVVSPHFNSPVPISPGKTWHLRTDTPANLSGVIWLGSLFVGLGQHGTISTSVDGDTWITHHSSTTHLLESASWSGSLFIIVGDHGTILTSPDGNTWTQRHSGTSQDLYDVEWSGSFFLVVGDNGTVLSSRTGSTWKLQTLNGFPSLYGVIWSGSLFLVVNSAGLLTSPDGSTWTYQHAGSQQAFDGLTVSGMLFVIIGNHGAIFTSHNGSTWTPQHSGTALNLYDIDWSGSIFVAVGQNGTILTSRDGSVWISQFSGTSLDLNIISCSHILCVATAQDGTLFTSP